IRVSLVCGRPNPRTWFGKPATQRPAFGLAFCVGARFFGLWAPQPTNLVQETRAFSTLSASGASVVWCHRGAGAGRAGGRQTPWGTPPARARREGRQRRLLSLVWLPGRRRRGKRGRRGRGLTHR